MVAKLVVVQTYIPLYRVPFFERLKGRLQSHGIELSVVASGIGGTQAKRGDESRLDWVTYVRPRQVDVGGRSLLLSSSTHAWRTADAVISLLQGTSLDTNLAVLRKRRLDIRVGLWGHVLPYTSAPNRLDLWVERQQMRRADHIFAYTDRGARRATEIGVPAEAVTAVQNTIDSAALLAAKRGLVASHVEMFREQHGLDPTRTFVFFGGLDKSKRIEFLGRALDIVWSADRRIKLLVGGLGEQLPCFEAHARRGQVVLLGQVGNEQKAVMAANAVGLMMPGRVGLVAVDALTLGLPILTTDWAFHGPEVDYLREGETRFTSSDSAEAYAGLILRRAHREEPPEGESLSSDWTPPSLDNMVTNFVAGVRAMLTA